MESFTRDVHLWLMNEEGSYRDVERMADAAGDAWELEKALRSYVEDLADETLQAGGLVADLLQSAIQEVDWYSLAETYWEDFRDGGSEEDEGINLVDSVGSSRENARGTERWRGSERGGRGGHRLGSS